MQVVHERCCGLDVHKRSVTACAMTPQRHETRTFSTMTEGLLELADWLQSESVTEVAMESTGVYWKPVYNLLEQAGFGVMVVNAQHIKAVPGRKTDVRDAEWIADLLRHGLLRASYIPPRPQRELRELVRHRKVLIDQRSEVVARIQAILEGANIKLSSVASNVVGASGRAMLEALVAGNNDPQQLAGLAQRKLKRKQVALEQALRGQVGPHQRFMLASQLRQLDFLDEEIERLSREVAERMCPLQELVERLDAIPGVGRRTIELVLAEIGTDMSRFPTERHLASWAKVSPGNNQSGGKRRSGATGKGNPWLRSTLVEAARAASRTRGTYFSAQYHRLAARRGGKRAALAVAHSLLVVMYHLMKRGTVYQDLGVDFFDERAREAVVQRSVRRLERLGYRVTLEDRAA